MHGGVPGKPLKTLAHIDQGPDLLISLVKLSQFRIDLKGSVNSDVQLIGDHLGKGIHIGIGQIHHPAHIPDYALCRQGTKGNDLNHLLRPIFTAYIVYDLLPSFVTEVNINIGHGNTLRIQETFKQKIISDGIDIGDLQRIGNNASRCRSTARPHHDPV